MKRAILVTPLAQEIPFFKDADYIGVDAGCLKIQQEGLPLAFGVGDFDSMAYDDLQALKRQAELEIHPVKKDETDSELALRLAQEKGYHQVILVGGLGGRIDHSLANIRLLMYRYSNLILWEKDQRVFVLEKGRHILYPEYHHISFLAIEQTILSLEGFLYPLSHKKIEPKDIFTVSNTLVQEKGIVTLEEGKVLCIQTNRI